MRRGSLVTLMAVMVVEMDKMERYILHPGLFWIIMTKDEEKEEES